MSHQYEPCALCGEETLVYATCDADVTAIKFKGKWICSSCVTSLSNDSVADDEEDE